jgi:hypothetical protein
MTGGTGTSHASEDLTLLEALADLATMPVAVPAARVFQKVHGRLPLPRDMRRLRRALARLADEGLVRVAVSLDLEVTADGRVAVEIVRLGRAARGDDARGPQPLSPTASIAS